ncbi:hypothetical protein [Diaphorobacter caeni]|uniref:hypothetical protein n=1 Tax=Diaphorobacter caeni TaxID=2784387 RepID=UPI00188DEA03|nr:hypothetical protein [Diaphorobacter caeni]MBF5007639.1 hypothetical protein [Diaphorobacter caeni]
MTDKCKISKGEITLCSAASKASSLGFIEVQAMRNHETNARRERVAIRKGKQSAPLDYCPWCRANIDTSSKEPT